MLYRYILLLYIPLFCNGFILGNKNIITRNIKSNLNIIANLDQSPSLVAKSLLKTGNYGETWSFNDLSTNIDKHLVDGVSLFTKNDEIKGIIAIDSKHTDIIDATNLHPVITGTSQISNYVVDLLAKNHVNFDTFMLPPSIGDLLSGPFQFIGFYLFAILLINGLIVIL